MMDLVDWKNPVARLEWGLEPRSTRRRIRAWWTTLWPAGLYFLLWLVIRAIFGNGIEFPDHGIRFSAFVMPFLLLILLTTIFLFHLALRTVPLPLRQENRNDFRLAGISGEQMLKGVAIAPFRAAACLTAVHILAQFWALGNPFNANSIPIIYISSLPVFALCLGCAIAPSLWVLCKGKFGRAVGIAGLIFGWIIFFYIMLFLFSLLLYLFPDVSSELIVRSEDLLTFIFLSINLALSLVIPVMCIKTYWRKAIRRLDDEDG